MWWGSPASLPAPSSWPASLPSIFPPWEDEASSAVQETPSPSVSLTATPSSSFPTPRPQIRSGSVSTSMRFCVSMTGLTVSHSQPTSMSSGMNADLTLVQNSELHYGEEFVFIFVMKTDFRPYNSSDPVMVPMNLEFIKDLWMPNIFIYNLKTYKVIDVLSKLAGLWIDTEKNVLYSQATHITFICPMRFDKFPLDTQTCRFRVGSYSYDSSKLLFLTRTYGYSSKDANSIALDYDIRK